jgi:hypothetical protein
MRIILFNFVFIIARDMNALKKKLVLNWIPFGISTIEGGLPKWYIKRVFKNKPRSFDEKKLSDIECIQEICLQDFGYYPSVEYCQKVLEKKK